MNESNKFGHERQGEHAEQLGAEHGGVDYERRDANPRKIMIATVSLLSVVVVLIIGLAELFTMVTENQIKEAVLKPESAPLRELRSKEREILNNYKIIDAAKGVYQIPITRAMDLVAEEAYQNAQKKDSKPAKTNAGN
ncbi:hypothetical protein F9K33_02205 [bacterium]|nr:MAG: hypothetical protein F9K33_02205 [bacterium]